MKDIVADSYARLAQENRGICPASGWSMTRPGFRARPIWSLLFQNGQGRESLVRNLGEDPGSDPGPPPTPMTLTRSHHFLRPQFPILSRASKGSSAG
jgi:hypothetical protein